MFNEAVASITMERSMDQHRVQSAMSDSAAEVGEKSPSRELPDRLAVRPVTQLPKFMTRAPGLADISRATPRNSP